MKKMIVVLTIFALLVLAGCGTKEAATGPASAPAKVIEIAEPADTEEAAPATEAETAEEAEAAPATEAETAEEAEAAPEVASEPVAAQIREITVSAKKWEFEPSTIEVNKGDRVMLTITSEDVEHGFSLPDFQVDVKLSPGKTVPVEFVADKAGTFDFFCSVYCGSGHRDMVGKLVVKE